MDEDSTQQSSVITCDLIWSWKEWTEWVRYAIFQKALICLMGLIVLLPIILKRVFSINTGFEKKLMATNIGSPPASPSLIRNDGPKPSRNQIFRCIMYGIAHIASQLCLSKDRRHLMWLLRTYHWSSKPAIAIWLRRDPWPPVRLVWRVLGTAHNPTPCCQLRLKLPQRKRSKSNNMLTKT